MSRLNRTVVPSFLISFSDIITSSWLLILHPLQKSWGVSSHLGWALGYSMDLCSSSLCKTWSALEVEKLAKKRVSNFRHGIYRSIWASEVWMGQDWMITWDDNSLSHVCILYLHVFSCAIPLRRPRVRWPHVPMLSKPFVLKKWSCVSLQAITGCSFWAHQLSLSRALCLRWTRKNQQVHTWVLWGKDMR